MWHIGKGVLSHAMSTCAGGVLGVALDGQTHGAPTTTAVGWCNNKHPVRRARANRELHFERNKFNFDCDRDRRH